MRIILLILISFTSTVTFSQSDEQKIKERAALFSSYLMGGEKQSVIEMYTTDAKIFPANKEILGGKDLAAYWNPPGESKWKTTFHKITPMEIKIWGSEAYDYGYFEGTSSNGEEESSWRGKYVVIWRKEDGLWKIYLDIWNRIAE